MLYNIARRFKRVRKFIGGHWIKTEHRGWITFEGYVLYLTYRFDPVYIKEEVYDEEILESDIKNEKNKLPL